VTECVHHVDFPFYVSFVLALGDGDEFGGQLQAGFFFAAFVNCAEFASGNKLRKLVGK
jgi:hypothetical protein